MNKQVKMNKIEPSSIQNGIAPIVDSVLMRIIPLLNNLVDRVVALEDSSSGATASVADAAKEIKAAAPIIAAELSKLSDEKQDAPLAPLAPMPSNVKEKVQEAPVPKHTRRRTAKSKS
jgi:hypothetical protein